MFLPRTSWQLSIISCQYGKFNTREFFRHRKRLFSRLDNVLKTMVGRGAMGLSIDRKNIKRSLGLNTKSLLHQLKKHPVPISNLPGFEKNHVKVRQYSKVLKGAGYVALGMDGLQSVAEVKKACTTGREKECARSKFSPGVSWGAQEVDFCFHTVSAMWCFHL